MKTQNTSIRSLRTFTLAACALMLARSAQAVPPPSQIVYYVANQNANTVNEYDAITGTPVVGFTPISLGTPFNLTLTGNFLIVSTGGGNSLAEYNATTGAAIGGFISPLSGLNNPQGLAVSGGSIFVANANSGFVTKYNLSDGTTVAGFTAPNTGGHTQALALFGNNLYVSNSSLNTVTELNATTGALIGTFGNPTVSGPKGLALSDDGSILYVANSNSNTVGSYNATTGVSINASLVPSTSGLSNPTGLSFTGGNLYVTSGNTVKVFDASSGNAGTGFTSPAGLNGPFGIVATPEPGSVVLAAVGGLGLLMRRRRNSATA